MIAQCQNYFWRHAPEQRKRHRWCYSINNVTIESYWTLLRKKFSDKWIRRFNELRVAGHFDGSTVDILCLRAVFMPILREELAEFLDIHNTTRIRTQQDTLRPDGIPDVLYHNSTFSDWALDVEPEEVDAVENLINYEGDPNEYLPANFRELYQHWLNGRIVVVENAVNMYLEFRNEFRRRYPEFDSNDMIASSDDEE